MQVAAISCLRKKNTEREYPQLAKIRLSNPTLRIESQKIPIQIKSQSLMPNQSQNLSNHSQKTPKSRFKSQSRFGFAHHCWFQLKDARFLNMLIVPELTQGADRQFQLSTTQSLLKLNFLPSNLNLILNSLQSCRLNLVESNWKNFLVEYYKHHLKS